MKQVWEDLRQAGAFLTVFPVGRGLAFEPARLARSMAFFPLVGLSLGLLLAAADRLLSLALPRGVADALVLLVLIGATGALHLDGVADLVDGLAGGRDREGTLRIMKDSRVGALGAVGLIMLLLLKYLSLTHIPSAQKTAALLLMPAAGRWCQVVLAANCSYLRAEGTGRAFVDLVGRREQLIASGSLLVAALLLFQLQGALILLLLGIAGALLVRYFQRRLGGVTGDVLGAATEVIEVLTLLLVLALA